MLNGSLIMQFMAHIAHTATVWVSRASPSAEQSKDIDLRQLRFVHYDIMLRLRGEIVVRAIARIDANFPPVPVN